MNIDSKKYFSNNVFYEKELLPIIEKLKKQGKKVGLCVGSFDVLHPGHITHLESAKKLCDVLIVAVALDSYSRNKKPGSGRPVFSQDIRAFIVSKLKPVDFVTFEDGTPRIIEALKPDLYIRGPDCAGGDNPGLTKIQKVVESYGGKNCYTDDEKLSTSEVIKHIKEEIRIE